MAKGTVALRRQQTSLCQMICTIYCEKLCTLVIPKFPTMREISYFNQGKVRTSRTNQSEDEEESRHKHD